MKRRWLVVPIVVGMLTLVITGGAILAQDNGTGEDSRSKGLAARVAAILGLEESQVQDAMRQAHAEMRTERLQHKLDRLVDAGRITEEQANEMMEWYEARPEGFPERFLGRGFNRHGFHGGWMWHSRGWHGKGFYQEPSETPAQ